MNKKRFAALFLAASLVMTAAAPSASAAEQALRIEEDTVIADAQAVKIVEEEVTLTVKGQVDSITVTKKAQESEILVKKGALIKELIVNGEDAEINVQKGATVLNVVLNAEAEIEGKGAVDTVTVNAEEAEIDVPNTKVIVGQNAEEVEAGDTELKPGDVVVINPDGNGVKPWEPQIPEVPQAHLVEQAKLVDLGWSKFVAVRFAKGQNLANTTLTVDGVVINEHVTSVTDDGSIVKWEVTSPSHAKLVVTSGDKTQTVSLGGTEAAPQLTAEGTPDYFLLNGPVYVWDYHLTNYDDAGNIRYAPARTTLSLGARADRMPSYSPDAILYHDDSALPYFVKGEVQLMFNYNTAAEKAFVDGITDVDLVSFKEYHNTLNDNLTYTIDTAFPHGDHTVACIQVPIGQVNFTSNGRYNLRVTSNGKADLYPIHVVEEVVPTMTQTPDTGYYGNEVHFRIENMTYGITRPIYRVELKNPAGENFTLALFDDWFLHGDLLVLYNTHHNYFPVAGEYTVTCYADGFQTFHKTFHHKGFVSELPEGQPVDIMTAATGGGSSSGGGGDAGDTKVMNANLILDADLLANAKILVSLGLKNDAAEGIAKRWDSMNKLYVFNQGGDPVYDAAAYMDAVNAAEAKGRYLTFADWAASEAAVTTPNRPYSVKQVLEDNLLGEATGFIEAVGKAAPALTLTAQDEKTATFTCNDAAYLAAAELRLNDGLLTADQYTVDGTTLVLNTVKIGRNTLEITAPGYKTNEVIFMIDKVMENVSLSAADIVKGSPIVITCGTEAHTCDFFANLRTVVLTAPNGKTDNILPEGQESLFEKIGYTVQDNTLTIGKDTLDQVLNDDGSFTEGTCKVTLTAEYYGTMEVTFHVTAPAVVIKAAPAVKDVTYKTQFMGGNYYNVSFQGTEEETIAFVAAINNISINGRKVAPVASFFNDTFSYKTSNDPSFGGQNRFVDFTEDCFKGTANVVISADGYEDLSFTLVDGKPVLPDAPAVAAVTREGGVMGQYHRLSFKGDASAYLKALTSVTVNGKEVKKVTNLFNETFSYKLSNDPAFGGDNIFVDFTADCLATGEVTLVLKAQGCKDLTVKLVDGALLKAVPGFQNFQFVADMFRGDHYRLGFTNTEAVAVDAVTAATGGGSVNPGIPPLPEPSEEMKALYAYVSALKTYLNEPRDSSITIDGVEVTESENATLNDSNSFLVIADEHDENRNAVVFNLDCFDNKKDAKVVIKVRGYEDLELTVSGRTVEEPDPEPEVPQGDKAAPTVADIQHKLSAISGNSFVVKMADPEVAVQDHTYTFLRTLTEVRINDVVFTEAASFGALGENQYRVNASSKEFVVSENAFGNGIGTFHVSLTAPGYQVMTFTVTDGQPAPEAPAVPAAPAILRLEHKLSAFSGNSFLLKLVAPQGVTDSQYVYTFLKALTEVKIGDAVLTEAGSFGALADNQYRLNASSGEVVFAENAFGKGVGSFTVSLKAQGYQDLTFTVVDGQIPGLETLVINEDEGVAEIETPAEPAEAPVEESGEIPAKPDYGSVF